MKTCIISFIAAFMAFTLPAALASDIPSPTATIKLQSVSGGSFRWHGVGEIESRTEACITSSTGRYRLTVNGGNEALLPYEITFTTREGEEQRTRVGSNLPILFEARTKFPSDCAGGTNATVTIQFSREVLSAALAGDYVRRLEFSVEPV